MKNSEDEFNDTFLFFIIIILYVEINYWSWFELVKYVVFTLMEYKKTQWWFMAVMNNKIFII
jgi:hypothetical protein